MFKRRRRPQRPTPEQMMILRKHGLEPPFHYLVIWDNGESMMVIHHETKEKSVIEK